MNELGMRWVAVGAVVGPAVEVVEAVEVVAAVGLVVAVGALVAEMEAAEEVAAVEAMGLVVAGQDLGVEALVVVSDSSSSVGARPSRPSSSVSGWFSMGRVGRPRWADLLRSGVAIFDLDDDAIISAMYALSFSAEGDCYQCVPTDPGIAAAALGASASGTPPGSAPAEALHTCPRHALYGTPSFLCSTSASVSALIAELLDFASACRLDYATTLVAESVPASPLSVGGECALGTDVLEDRQEDFECLAVAVPRFASMLLAPEGDPDAPDIPTPRSYAEAITCPYSSQWQAAMDAEMASWKSTGTYVDELPPPGMNIGVDYFQTFSPTPKMTTLRVLLQVAAQRDYELYSLDFSTAFLHGSLHEDIWLRRPLGFIGTFPAGTQWSLRRPVYGLHQVPHEWHDTLRTTLASLGFAPFTADPSLFLRTDTSLLPFYVLVYVDDLVFATADTEALTLVKSELQKRHTCTDLGELRSHYTLKNLATDKFGSSGTGTGTDLHLAWWHWHWQPTHSRLSWPVDHPGQSTAHHYTDSVTHGAPGPSALRLPILLATAYSSELLWLTYLLTDLGEQPRSSPDLYVDNKAMIALCQEHRLEHITKHIALRYFLARELQQCGQLRLAYVATWANTANVFTKALLPGPTLTIQHGIQSRHLPAAFLNGPTKSSAAVLPFSRYGSAAVFCPSRRPAERATPCLPVVRPEARDGALLVVRPEACGGFVACCGTPGARAPPPSPLRSPRQATGGATWGGSRVAPSVARHGPLGGRASAPPVFVAALPCPVVLPRPCPSPALLPPLLRPCPVLGFGGGEGLGVVGVWVMGGVFPFPSSSFRSHCCSSRWGEGCEGVGEPGEWHWGGGCETIQPPSL
ncbi:unnamed protein product [Closterium sp. NIES-54]